ncbi:hypothetical protein FRB94_005217 [Tulasnella sp. JGI-2019a]|nr:hypothetical protein FRB93_013777 [Tulasnella sp. JGI-2019a]KAG9000710.1 hypothetical protein FRB94_005217 [Tulasnella sp. JGI-2019a]
MLTHSPLTPATTSPTLITLSPATSFAMAFTTPMKPPRRLFTSGAMRSQLALDDKTVSLFSSENLPVQMRSGTPPVDGSSMNKDKNSTADTYWHLSKTECEMTTREGHI